MCNTIYYYYILTAVHLVWYGTRVWLALVIINKRR